MERTGSYEVVPGTTMPGGVGQPIATGTSRATATTISASGFPEFIGLDDPGDQIIILSVHPNAWQKGNGPPAC